jgi:probable F420-dependent oxidoreductase
MMPESLAPNVVRIAVLIGQQHADFKTLREAALRAEDSGVDIVFNFDHFFPYTGDPSGKCFEALTMLAALAELTKRVELGTLVTGVGYRNPNLLADMARTIDHISHGRFILGLGAGWYERDYSEYGYEFPSTPERLRNLRRALPTIRQRFARLNPQPLRPIPILIGGEGERVTLRIVAEHADIWHTYADIPGIRHKSEVLARWCRQNGRDPASITRSTSVYGRFDRRHADALREAGVRIIVREYEGPAFDFNDLKPWLDWRDELNSTASGAVG